MHSACLSVQPPAGISKTEPPAPENYNTKSCLQCTLKTVILDVNQKRKKNKFLSESLVHEQNIKE